VFSEDGDEKERENGFWEGVYGAMKSGGGTATGRARPL